MTTISMHGLTVTYGEVVALKDVSLDIGPGLTVLVGVNGSGKSSLLGAISGAVRPTRGTVTVDGQPAAAARTRGAIAYVPQVEAIDRDFPVTVLDVVSMGRYASSAGRADNRRAVRDAIERVGLAGLERRQIGELSGGQRRRVLIARAVAQDAAALVLDEPEAGVDSAARQSFYALMRTFIDEGRTVLMATHDLAAVPDLADHAVVLQRRVIAQGAPRDVLTPETLAQAFGVAP